MKPRSATAHFIRHGLLGIVVLYIAADSSSFAQVTNNSSALTNSAAPSASSVTTGGTNVNYQTNNQWSNEIGFGPGIFCRTPTFYVGSSVGTTNNNNDNQNFGDSANYGQNISGNLGILVPFGSSTLRDCQRLSAQIVRDRQISTELSMIRACYSLKKEGIKVDPQKYPLLALCALDDTNQASTSTPSASSLAPVKPNPDALHNTTIKKAVISVEPPSSAKANLKNTQRYPTLPSSSSSDPTSKIDPRR